MNLDEKDMQNKECLVLKEYLKKSGMNQNELVYRCCERGYSISQSSLSKVLSGQKKMSLEECKAFCDVLKISADELLFGSEWAAHNSDAFFLLSRKNLEYAKALLGEYKIYYSSTAAEEGGRLIEGRLRLCQKGEWIQAVVLIQVNKESEKAYEGYLMINREWPVAYIVLKRMITDEISVLALRYREFLHEAMKCRMALCLTTGAGEKKNPVAHQVALFRKNEVQDNREFLQSVETYLKKSPHSYLDVEDDVGIYQLMKSI